MSAQMAFLLLNNYLSCWLFLVLNHLALSLFDFWSKHQPIPHKIVFLSYNLAR